MTVRTESLPDMKVLKSEVVETIIKNLGITKAAFFIRAACKSIKKIVFAVIPAKAGIQKSLVLKNTGFPIKTSGMTNSDFCKSLIIETISQKTDYLDIKEKLFGSKTAAEIYSEISDWKKKK